MSNNPEQAKNDQAPAAPKTDSTTKTFTRGQRVRFNNADEKITGKVTAVHENGLYDIQEEPADPDGESRWFQNIAASELTAVA